MKYALLIYSATDVGPQTEEEQAAEMPAWFGFSAELDEAGLNLGGEALLPAEMSKTVRIREGQRVDTDGPFAETKEVLGGFYIIEAPDIDAAAEWAAKIPAAPYGAIEVRPVLEIPGA